jgi:hypothetical protein
MKKTSQRLNLCVPTSTSGPEWPVTVLPNGSGKRWLAQGILDLLAIDPAQLTRVIDRRVYEATRTGEAFHDPQGARAAMEGWGYPRTWLDFETIGFAVPRWHGTRPHQPVPFQFSAHIEQSNGDIEHQEFLSLDGTDPRRACAEALVDMIPLVGAVIAYNASFEKRCIVELASAFPDLEERLRAIADRVVDLLPVTRASWYHRDQRSRPSCQQLLPNSTMPALRCKTGAALRRLIARRSRQTLVDIAGRPSMPRCAFIVGATRGP